MAELAMLADIQQRVYPKEVTRQPHIMMQAREGSLVIDRRSNHCATPPTSLLYKTAWGFWVMMAAAM